MFGSKKRILILIVYNAKFKSEIKGLMILNLDN